MIQKSSELADHFLNAHFSDGSSISMSARQEIVTEAGPVFAGYLRAGAKLYGGQGAEVVRVEEVRSPTTLYCLILDGGDPFFVDPGLPIQVFTGDKNCLLGDTPIVLEDGEIVAIETLRVGQRVAPGQSRIASGKSIVPTIRSINRSIVPMYLEVNFENGAVLRCSSGHPIMTTAGPVPAGGLFLGAPALISSGGDATKVVRIDAVFSEAVVYRLDLDGGVTSSISMAGTTPLVVEWEIKP